MKANWRLMIWAPGLDNTIVMTGIYDACAKRGLEVANDGLFLLLRGKYLWLKPVDVWIEEVADEDRP